MKNFIIPFKYNALQIFDESILVYCDRFSHLPNFHNLMIFIMKKKWSLSMRKSYKMFVKIDEILFEISHLNLLISTKTIS